MHIKHKILLAMSFIILVASISFSVILYKTQEKTLLHGIDAQLLTAAQMARAMLPRDYHDRISSEDSVSQQRFSEIVDRFNELCVKLDLQY